ncbi:hypothetical protein A2U01_0070683, partial [Trifolium medium]|nr:hypothetical protein [Trifolium medium]
MDARDEFIMDCTWILILQSKSSVTRLGIQLFSQSYAKIHNLVQENEFALYRVRVGATRRQKLNHGRDAPYASAPR